MTISSQMQRVGGPEVLVATDSEVLDPGPGEVRIRQSTIGVSFVDIYHCTGLYPLPKLPAVLSVEGAGVVEAVGDGVVNLHAAAGGLGQMLTRWAKRLGAVMRDRTSERPLQIQVGAEAAIGMYPAR